MIEEEVIPTEEIKNTEEDMSDNFFLRLASDAYEGSEKFVDSYLRKQWEDGLRQWQSKHRANSKYNTESFKQKSKLFRPRTRAVIRKNEASAASAYFSTQDVVNVTAENDGNEADLMTAEIMNGVLNYHLTNTIPWFQLVTGAYQNAQVYGQVCSYQYWKFDDKNDQPCVDLRPIENIRIDPAADWLDPVNSSPYLIDLIPMYIMDIQEKMKVGEWIKLDETILLAASGEYYDSTRMAREDREDSKSNNYTNNNKFSTVWVRRNIIRVKGEDYLFYTVGHQHLLSTPEKLQTIDGKRPYVIGNCIVEANRAYPSSLPDLTKDVQNEINNVTNSRMDNVMLALNKRFHAKRNRKVDLRSLTKNVAGSVTLMDNLEDVKVFDIPDVTSSSFNEQDRLNLDFDDLAGVFSGSSVQANRSLNETVGGMDMMNQSANQLGEYQLRTFTETWAEPVLKQLLNLVAKYEENDLILAIAGNGSKMFVEQGLEQVTEDMLMGRVILNVNVGTGATNPQTQVDRFFFGLNTLAGTLGESFVQKIDVDEVIQEVFGKLGYKDGKRFFIDDEGQDPRIAELEAQLQEAQRLLELKYDPAEQEAKIRKIDADTKKVGADTKLVGVDAVNKSVEATFSAMSSAEKIALLPQIVDTASQILDSAGYEDQDNIPLQVPQVAIDAPAPALNTNPTTPINPNVGMNAGIEGGQ